MVDTTASAQAQSARDPAHLPKVRMRAADRQRVPLHRRALTLPMTDAPEGGGAARGPKMRGSSRMIAALAAAPAWVASLSPEMRAEVVRKLTDGLAAADSPREVASVAKALASLEKNDIDRTKLLMEAETQEGDGLDDARRLRADLDEIDRMEGRRAD